MYVKMERKGIFELLKLVGGHLKNNDVTPIFIKFSATGWNQVHFIKATIVPRC